MNGRILVEDLRVWAVVGVHPHEREFPRLLRLDLELTLDLAEAARQDQLDATLDYDWLCRRIRHRVVQGRRATLEAVAEDVLTVCLENPRVRAARVRVDKPGAVRGVGTVAIEMGRERGGA